MRQHLKIFAKSITRPPRIVANSVLEGNASVKIKHAARKTIDDVAMTPFLRKITFFFKWRSVSGRIRSFFDRCCIDANYSFV